MKIKLNLPSAGAEAAELERAAVGFSGEFDRVLAVVRNDGRERQVLACMRNCRLDELNGIVYPNPHSLLNSGDLVRFGASRERILLLLGVPAFNHSLPITIVDVINCARRQLSNMTLVVFVDADSATKIYHKDGELLEISPTDCIDYGDDLIITVRREQVFAELRALVSVSGSPLYIVDTSDSNFPGYDKLFVKAD
jgi:hypothetical protein